MAYCILPDKNSLEWKEYQLLSERAGISPNDKEHKSFVEYFRSIQGRTPHLDEIKGADSKDYLTKQLGITGNDTKYASTKRLEEFTLEKDPIKMQQKLNSIFADKEIELIPIGEDTIIKIVDRPSIYKFEEADSVDITDPDSTTFFIDGLYKLANFYGVDFKITNNKEVELKFSDLNINNNKAFIYQGDIYINIDLADVKSPVHEMLHLLVGSMRFTNPVGYSRLLDFTLQLPNYEQLSKKYVNRTVNDVTEEILIEQVSKLLTSKTSQLIPEQYYDIFYEIRRNLDTLLMGKHSVGNIPIDSLFKMSLKDIGKLVKSQRLVNNFSGLISDAYAHRLLGNVKSDLMKKNDLKEYCI